MAAIIYFGLMFLFLQSTSNDLGAEFIFLASGIVTSIMASIALAWCDKDTPDYSWSKGFLKGHWENEPPSPASPNPSVHRTLRDEAAQRR
jgi:hypothetical protein